MDELIKALKQFYGLRHVQTERIAHPHDLRPTYIVNANKNTYLLKKYDWFDEHRSRGLQVVNELNNSGYPALSVVKTKEESYTFAFAGETFALFEYIPNMHELNNQKPVNWAFLLGSSLGKLHNFKPKTKFDPNYESSDDFVERFHDRAMLYENQMPNNIYLGLLEIIPKLDFSDISPKCLVHNEFTLEHVLFKNSKVYKVIDWDELSIEGRLYDLGVTLTEAYPNGTLDNRIFDNLLTGYTSTVNLSKQELDGIDKAVIWGHFKFLVWSMKKDGTGTLNKRSLKALDSLL